MRFPDLNFIELLGNNSIRNGPFCSVLGRSRNISTILRVSLSDICAFSRQSYAIIWCIAPRSVLNYLEPVAPYRSNRDGKIRTNHAELHRTGRPYRAQYY